MVRLKKRKGTARLAGPLGGHGTLQWASHIYPISAAAGPPLPSPPRPAGAFSRF